jgi:hypothetical protein
MVNLCVILDSLPSGDSTLQSLSLRAGLELSRPAKGRRLGHMRFCAVLFGVERGATNQDIGTDSPSFVGRTYASGAPFLTLILSCLVEYSAVVGHSGTLYSIDAEILTEVTKHIRDASHRHRVGPEFCVEYTGRRGS